MCTFVSYLKDYKTTKEEWSSHKRFPLPLKTKPANLIRPFAIPHSKILI